MLAALDERERRLRALLLRGLDGDERAYHAFLEQLCPHLRAFLRRRMGSLPDDVEDLVQDTLIALHAQRHTYRTELPVTAWAQAIARYKLVDLLRSRGRCEDRCEPLDDDAPLQAPDAIAVTEARLDLDTLMRDLPDRHGLPILHTRLYGASVAEAAAATGLSASAIKVGVHRGLKALARRLRGVR